MANPDNGDEGVYFDMRPDSPALWHFSAACEVGRAIPRVHRWHTDDAGKAGELRDALEQCPECREVVDAQQIWRGPLE